MLKNFSTIQTREDLLIKYITQGRNALTIQEQERLNRILPILAKKLEGKSMITTAPLTDTERAAMDKYSNEELLQESIDQGYGLGLGKVKKQRRRKKQRPRTKRRPRTTPKHKKKKTRVKSKK